MEKVEVAPPRRGEVRIKVKTRAGFVKHFNTIFQEQWLLLKCLISLYSAHCYFYETCGCVEFWFHLSLFDLMEFL